MLLQSMNSGSFTSGTGGFFIRQQSTSQGASVLQAWQAVITAQLFRGLQQGPREAEAVALLRIGGSVYDDVLRAPKVYATDL